MKHLRVAATGGAVPAGPGPGRRVPWQITELEHDLIRGLRSFEYEVKGKRIVPIGDDDNGPGRAIAPHLQEQELLKKLLPTDGT